MLGGLVRSADILHALEATMAERPPMLPAVALALALGAAWGPWLQPAPAWLALAPAGLLLAWWRPGRLARVLLLLTLVVAAASWREARSLREAPGDVAAMAPRRHLALHVVVETPPEGGVGRWRAVARAEAGRGWRTSRVLVRFPPDAARPRPGERWRLLGRLARLEPAANPGGFDARAFWAEREVHAALRAREGAPLGLSPLPADRLRASLDELRMALLGGLVVGLPPDRAALLGSLLLGAGAAPVPRELACTFRDAGLSHLLAASGAQVALIGGLMVALVRGVGGAIWLQVGVATTALAVYLGLTGAAPGMVRATAMGMIALAGLALERSPVPFAALWTTVAGMIVLDPSCIADLGFQFSVLATYALLRLAHAGRSWQIGPAWLAAGLAAPIVTWAWVAPWQVWTFQSLPLAGIPANWVSGPLVAALTPWAFVVALVGCVWPAAAALANHLTAWGLEALVAIAALAVAVPGQLIAVPAPSPWSVAGAYVALALGLRRWRPAMACLGLTLSLAAWPGPRGLEVAVLAVGQGDAIVIRTPGGQTALIDGGPAGPGFDAGAGVVLPYLRRLGVREISLVVATHPHQDHVGGLGAIAAALPVAEAWEAGLPGEGGPTASLLAAWLRQGVRWRVATEGPLVWQADGVRLEVLPRPAHPPDRVNDASLVIRLTYGRTRLLLPGDLEVDGERALMAAGVPLDADILKVGHHGGRGATSDAWLKAVQPALAIVSAGAVNAHGHPHGETLTRLTRAGCELARTDRHGAVLLRSDSRAWLVTDRRSAWRHWRPVSAGGRRARRDARVEPPELPCPPR